MPSRTPTRENPSKIDRAPLATWCQGLVPSAVALPDTGRAAANEEAADDDDDRELPSSPVPAAREQSATVNMRLRMVVAERLTRARALAGLTQTEAAYYLGYKTQAQLSLWEMNRRMPPIAYVIQAAEVYGVSTDFILGISDEPDRDPSAALRHACLRGVRRQLERVAEVTLDAVVRQAHLIGPDAINFRNIVGASDALAEAMSNFTRLNAAAFDGMRGSATVLRLCGELEAELADARAVLRRHDEHERQMRESLAALGDKIEAESAETL